MRTTKSPVLKLLTALIAVALVLLVGGCKDSDSDSSSAKTTTTNAAGVSSGDDFSCPESNTIKFAKTKFVTHAGLGFGAFHRYIYKPAKNGGFKKGADGRIKAFAKAGLAALFVKREVRLAAEDAKANPTLCKAVAAPLKSISDKISDAVSKARNGDLAGVEDVEKSVTGVMKSSKDQGDEITPDENADITGN
ncbi:hypothetical protein M2359_004671 [Gordonia amarae]|uniref:Lipoprotein n=1 Tax=Gordonia amarae NBRC 15530 TaxID=1075090 RepID=G7GM98_9ACTN|nr:hypothetical protein [Gordonia amarae]MCS3881042.1 hypothetical protein [Gordonia amarae]GAB04723.1 hypothetical protein GOAMR_20_02740 [Gordonia amarae NBRC 15530]